MDPHGSFILLSNLIMVLLGSPYRGWFLSSSKNLLNLSIHKRKLPQYFISFINIENLDKSEYGMYTMLSPSTPTGAGYLRPNINFELFLRLVLNGHFGWPLLVHEIEPLAKSSIVVTHELSGWVLPIWF